MNDTVADQARGFIDLVKDEPAIIAVSVISVVAGFVLNYFLVRKGYISTPTMTQKMAEMHQELEMMHVENAELKKEIGYMKADYEKYHELLNSFLAMHKLNLMDKMALESGKKD